MSHAATGTVRAKKSLGQHFLHDQSVIHRIVDALDIGPGDRILEIGPGPGALTREMAARGPARLAVVEKDRDLAAAIVRDLGVELAGTDAMDFSWQDLAPGAKVAGNLPYNVASPIMWDSISRAPAERFVYMMQKEVALRILAAPGAKAYGALTVWLASFARARKVLTVGPGAFAPPPKVDSTVLAFVPLPEAERPRAPRALAALVKRLFQQRRKQLGGILRAEMDADIEELLEGYGLTPRSRPESLPPGGFQALADKLSKRL